MRGFRKPRKRNMRLGPRRKLEFQAPYTQSGILLLVCGLSCYFWATRLQGFMKIQTWRILFHRDALMHTCINSHTHTHIFLSSKVKPEENWDFLHTALHGSLDKICGGWKGGRDIWAARWNLFRKWGRVLRLWGIDQLKSVALRVRASIVKMTAR